jgi:hypothetical protein
MPETALVLGAKVDCVDGPCGVLHTLVVRPVAPQVARLPQVTHVIVEPEHRIGLGRLVPIGLIASSNDVVQLTSDLATFNLLPLAESTEVVQDLSAGYIFLHSTVLPRTEVHEVLPEGEAGLRPGTEVVATDGAIGVVGGLVTTGDDHTVSSVLVSEERLLWGHKTVAIPMSAVAAFDVQAVQLHLARAEVEQVAQGFSGRADPSRRHPEEETPTP